MQSIRKLIRYGIVKYTNSNRIEIAYAIIFSPCHFGFCAHFELYVVECNFFYILISIHSDDFLFILNTKFQHFSAPITVLNWNSLQNDIGHWNMCIILLFTTYNPVWLRKKSQYANNNKKYTSANINNMLYINFKYVHLRILFMHKKSAYFC